MAQGNLPWAIFSTDLGAAAPFTYFEAGAATFGANISNRLGSRSI
jgi:hypothetical protein